MFSSLSVLSANSGCCCCCGFDGVGDVHWLVTSSSSSGNFNWTTLSSTLIHLHLNHGLYHQITLWITLPETNNLLIFISGPIMAGGGGATAPQLMLLPSYRPPPPAAAIILSKFPRTMCMSVMTGGPPTRPTASPNCPHPYRRNSGYKSVN